MIRVHFLRDDEREPTPAAGSGYVLAPLSDNARTVLAYLGRAGMPASVGLVRVECFTDAEPAAVLALLMSLERRGYVRVTAQGYQITTDGMLLVGCDRA